MSGQEIKVVGFGFRSGASLVSLAGLLDTLTQRFGAIDALAATQSMRPLVQSLGQARCLNVILVADAHLPGVTTLTHSAQSLQARGTGSVAEAVALLAAGPGAQLLGPRHISADRQATAAIAIGTSL
ncbi:cobalamin biosynthesis protein [Halomonas sp. CUBES01]|uniref:cobalamin biosynthesis protein n=1 Tax=Halomonas sp. CUBES01 TaxID=2897340 RepID=UPI001E3AADE6|nr:cobalamin biosynthesis protein [Halomonas sp. CUBES01]MEC4767624.1 cobalamin biosynthesis protein [Halomonas sp. CUBES01]